MAEEMRCWWRRTTGNRVGRWHEGEDLHLEWIRGYFHQPIRDHPVWVSGRDENGDQVTLHCWCNSNEKITGRMEDEQVEIVWARREREEADVLARYSE
jgi:hypothetical protein